MDKENFAKWLQEKLDERNWNQSDLSRKSGVSTGQITRLMKGERGIGFDGVEALAHALRLPPEEVFRAAGILPPKKDQDPWVEEMDGLLSEIPANERERVRSILLTFAEKEADDKLLKKLKVRPSVK